MRRIAVVVAHEDDEALIAGGFISQSEQVKVISVVYVTEDQRRTARINAQKFGFEFTPLNQKQWHINLPQAAEEIHGELTAFRPDIVITHPPFDTHQEHKTVSHAVEIATRGIVPRNSEHSHFVNTVVYGYGTGAFENTYQFPKPNAFVRLSESDVERKLDMLRAYGREMRGIRNEENALVDARFWGRFIGAEYAEPFLSARIVF